MPNDPIRILKTRELTQRTGIPSQTLRVMRMRGTGPKWIRIARNRVGYLEADVLEWLAARRFQSIAEERHGRPAA